MSLLAGLAARRANTTEQAISRSSSQQLRQEQDAAYLRSLAADAKKAEEKKQVEELMRKEVEKQAAEAEEYQRKLRMRSEAIARLISKLNAIPTTANMLKLSVQLPDGTRIIRAFPSVSSVSLLYDWIFTEVGKDDPDVLMEHIQVRVSIPARYFPNEEGKSLSDAGIVNLMKLIAEVTN